MPHNPDHLHGILQRAHTVDLRHAQAEMLQQAKAHLLEQRHVLLRMPPNGGKTTVALATMAQILSEQPEATALYLCSSWLNAIYAIYRIGEVSSLGCEHLARGGGAKNLLHSLGEWGDNPNARLAISTYGVAAEHSAHGWQWPTPTYIICDDIERIDRDEREWLTAILGNGINARILSTSGYELRDDPLEHLGAITIAHNAVAAPGFGVAVPDFNVIKLQGSGLRAFLRQRTPGRALVLYNPYGEYTYNKIIRELKMHAPAYCSVRSNAEHPAWLPVDTTHAATASNYASIQQLHGHDAELLIAVMTGIGEGIRADTVTDVLLIGSVEPRWLTAGASRALAITDSLSAYTKRTVYIAGVGRDESTSEELKRLIIEQLGNVTLIRHTAGGAGRAQFHGWDPAQSEARQFSDNADLDPALRGLWTHDAMTFGVEFEFTRRDWTRNGTSRLEWQPVAHAIRRALSTVESFDVARLGDLATKDQWSVEPDASCGWEVVSPILRSQSGYRDIVKACDALRGVVYDQDLVVNYRTGLHVHFGWAETEGMFSRADAFVAHYQGAIATLVPPSRICHFDGSRYDENRPNHFAPPVTTTPRDVRYRALNFLAYDKFGTVEVRLHSGSYEAGKVLLWVSLWQQMLWYIWENRDAPPFPANEDHEAIARPRGDILELAQRIAPDQGAAPTMFRRLDQRRREILAHWEREGVFADCVELAQNWKRVGGPA